MVGVEGKVRAHSVQHQLGASGHADTKLERGKVLTEGVSVLVDKVMRISSKIYAQHVKKQARSFRRCAMLLEAFRELVTFSG